MNEHIIISFCLVGSDLTVLSILQTNPHQYFFTQYSHISKSEYHINASAFLPTSLHSYLQPHRLFAASSSVVVMFSFSESNNCVIATFIHLPTKQALSKLFRSATSVLDIISLKDDSHPDFA